MLDMGRRGRCGGVGGPGMQWIWWLDLGVGLREKLRWDPHVLCLAVWGGRES